MAILKIKSEIEITVPKGTKDISAPDTNGYTTLFRKIGGARYGIIVFPNQKGLELDLLNENNWTILLLEEIETMYNILTT